MGPDSDILYFYPIFFSPDDFPGRWVLRRQALTKDNTIVPDPPGKEVVGNSIEEVRKALPPGVHNLGRQSEDVISLVECWI